MTAQKILGGYEVAIQKGTRCGRNNNNGGLVSPKGRTMQCRQESPYILYMDKSEKI